MDKENSNEKKNNTGEKKVFAAVTTLVLVGGLVVGGITGAKYYRNHSENYRTKSLVQEYTVDGLLTLPDEVTINQAYDISFCDGQTLYNQIVKSGVKYCQAVDEYYTSDGRDIAILTIDGTCLEVVDAIETKIGDAVIYTAPEGYELNGHYGTKVVNQSFTKVIEVMSDYSGITIEGLDNVTINVREIHTKPFEDIISEVLIVDVPDNAVLNQNQECTGSLKFAPKE